MANTTLYTVSQTARIANISPSSVRLWVKELEAVLSPGANPPAGVERRFTPDDCAALHTARVMRQADGAGWQAIIAAIRAGNLILPPPMPAGEIVDTAGEAHKLAVMSGQLEELRRQLEAERAGRIDAERRAAIAETRLQLLAEPLQSPTKPPKPESDTDTAPPAANIAERPPEAAEATARSSWRQRMGRWIAGR